MKGAIILLFALIAVAYTQNPIYVGYARIRGGSLDSGISGDVYFIANTVTGNVTVWANINGITSQVGVDHGMHVHQYGEISDLLFANTGTHYTGNGSTTHGCEDTNTRHQGDMGNWAVSAQGTIVMNKTLNLLVLTGGFSIIGKAVVLHNTTDNCVVTGSAGGRLAAGVIGVPNPAQLPADVAALAGYSATNNVSAAVSGDTTVTKAIAILTPASGSSVYGVVLFSQSGNSVIVTANITGLNSSSTGYGFHVHQYGDLHSTDALATGDHYNPNLGLHGIPPNASRHAGDMGNICSFDAAGQAYFFFTFTDLLTIGTANNVVGLAVVIHAQRDPGFTPFGTRIAQGIIGVANPTATTITIPGAVTIKDPSCPLPAVVTTTTTTAATTTTTAAASTTTTTAVPVTTTATTAKLSTSGASSVVASVGILVLVAASLL